MREISYTQLFFPSYMYHLLYMITYHSLLDAIYIALDNLCSALHVILPMMDMKTSYKLLITVHAHEVVQSLPFDRKAVSMVY